MSINIGHTLAECASKLADDTALIEASTGHTLSFKELNNRANAFAGLLNAGGVNPGNRVMLMVKPSADFICLTFALFKIGAPVILIDPGMGYKNLLRCIEGVKPEFFIGIPKAQIFRKLFPNVFKTIKKSFCCGNSFGILGTNICKKVSGYTCEFKAFNPGSKDLAAIIFTTGSTGPPKGVRYEHSIFYAQLRLIRDYYKIGPGETDQPAFPLFALFSTALGAKAVIPNMDPTRPAKVDPEIFTKSIRKYDVSYSFGSPAIWNVIANYCQKNDSSLQSLKKVLMAGAPVSGDLLQKMYEVLPDDAEIHTPYGATESLPIVSIEGKEITQSTWPKSLQGKGTCVGRSLPGIEIQIVAINDGVINKIMPNCFLEADKIGEIIVRGDVVTRAYENNEKENQMSKIPEGKTFWHRMGDVGYLDTKNRLWFCGRRAHRVENIVLNKCYYSIPCESVFNGHIDIYRSALVGVYSPKKKTMVPAIIIEPQKNKKTSDKQLIIDARELGFKNALTKEIVHYLIYPDFPVDIRHNAKIFREKLAVWSEKQLEADL
jgi:acyl-CoA synthetase (AMP-forming)/AMP-acid ligase II